jgi:hypothetical protein
MWKVVRASVRGTAHEKDGTPCQDFQDFRALDLGGDEILLIAISDGAGSAKLSHVGSKEAVEMLLNRAAAFIKSVEDLTESDLLEWFRETISHLDQTARCLDSDVRDLNCTLLFAAVGTRGGVFAQVGDGAWVCEIDGIIDMATWPTTGEFVNQTAFVTADDAFTSFQFRKIDSEIGRVAGFTDGVQSIALQLSARTVYRPFFRPIFEDLDSSDDTEMLNACLASFLGSQKVNERTNDDKTLVLARYVKETPSDGAGQ